MKYQDVVITTKKYSLKEVLETLNDNQYLEMGYKDLDDDYIKDSKYYIVDSYIYTEEDIERILKVSKDNAYFREFKSRKKRLEVILTMIYERNVICIKTHDIPHELYWVFDIDSAMTYEWPLDLKNDFTGKDYKESKARLKKNTERLKRMVG